MTATDKPSHEAGISPALAAARFLHEEGIEHLDETIQALAWLIRYRENMRESDFRKDERELIAAELGLPPGLSTPELVKACRDVAAR